MADFLGLRINLIHLQQHHTISPRFVCRYLSYAIVQLHPRSPRRLTRRIFFALFSKTILISLCKAYFYACFLLTTIPLVFHCHVTSVHFSPPRPSPSTANEILIHICLVGFCAGFFFCMLETQLVCEGLHPSQTYLSCFWTWSRR